VAEAVRDITAGKMASVVIECTGTASGMNLTLDLARPLGRVSLPGFPMPAAGPVARQYPIEKIATHVLPLEEAEKGNEAVHERRSGLHPGGPEAVRPRFPEVHSAKSYP